MSDENPDKKKPKTRPAGQIIKRGEKKYLIRIFLDNGKLFNCLLGLADEKYEQD